MKGKSKSILAAPPIITLYGSESVKIENIIGISGFNSDSIAVKVAGGIVLAEGNGLEIGTIEDSIVIIQGEIRGVSFV